MSIVRAIALASAAFLAACNGTPAGVDRTEQDRIKVRELLDIVKQALRDAQNEIAADKALPPLASVSLTLQTKVATGVSATADLLIVSGQVKGEDAATQAISVKLTPPTPGPRILSKTDELYKSIVVAIRAAADAAKQAMASDPKDLQLDSVAATVAFDVSRTVSGGLKLDLAGLKIGPGASYATSGSQKIELVFQRPTR